ncbi:hypothetical protein BD779DRAFT_1565404, partial [Infundibulicybe gibba]
MKPLAEQVHEPRTAKCTATRMNMIQRGASSPWPPRRSTAGGNKADTAPVTAQYGGPLRKPANSGHA